jgi:hypothetical protein
MYLYDWKIEIRIMCVLVTNNQNGSDYDDVSFFFMFSN